MVPVPRPAETVHDVFMAPPRQPFHEKDGGNDNGKGTEERHNATVLG